MVDRNPGDAELITRLNGARAHARGCIFELRRGRGAAGCGGLLAGRALAWRSRHLAVPRGQR
eukprot:2778713-Pyramimonas_sp.AAC.1